MSETTAPEASKSNKELLDLKISINITRDFLTLVELLDTLPDMSKVPYDVTRSLYQAVSKGRDIETLGKELEGFFGPPKKPAGKPMPVKMRFNPSIKYLNGIREEQALYIKKTKNGFYYGALWPWYKVAENITVHLGYCGNKMTAKDFENLEKLAKTRALNEKVFDELESGESRVNGISLPSFLQMAELEKMTCALNVKAESSQGRLFLLDGNLIDAETGNLGNRAAAYRIISWDNAEIDIQDAGEKNQNKINQPLVEILAEALRLRNLREESAKPDVKKSKAAARPSDSRRSRRKDDPAAPSTNGRYEALMEAAKEPKGGAWKTILAAGLSVALVLLVAGKFALHVLEGRAMRSGYEDLMAEVSVEEDLFVKQEILQSYLNDTGRSEFRDQAEKELEAVNSQIEKQDYAALVAEIEQLPIDENYEAIATELYSDYIDKYPIGVHTADVQDRLAGIRQLIDDVDYKKLETAVQLDHENRIEAYLEYLLKHPDGRYRRRVETYISEMGDDYYNLLNQKIGTCDRNQDWDACIVLCDKFLKYFDRDYRVDEIKYIKWEMEDKKDFTRLLAKVDKAGDNYQKAKRILINYLEENPDTIKAEEIQADIARLDRRINRLEDWQKVAAFTQNSGFNVAERIQYMQVYLQQNPSGPFLAEANSILSRLQDEYRYARQQQAESALRDQQALAQQAKLRLENELKSMVARVEQSGSRYELNGDGTFTDTRTGLVWTLLDSVAELGECHDYRKAKSYVATLQTGGFDDWRLPRGSELTALYKTEDAFPENGTPWYWTSETFDRGYHRQALVVTTKKEKVFKRRQMKTEACGAVRAVRP